MVAMLLLLLLVVAVAMVVPVMMVVVMAFSMNPSFLSPDSLSTLIPDRKGCFFSLGLSLCPKENRISA